MKKWRILDKNFKDQDYSSKHQRSKYIEWIRKRSTIRWYSHLFSRTFVTDRSISKYHNKNRIAWILEPREIHGEPYSWIEKNYEKYSQVLTFDKALLELDGKFKFVPAGGCWIDAEDRDLHEKNKNISIIASNKKQTVGHKMRHSVIERVGESLDLYGRAYKSIENKISALKDYRFSITIENTKRDFYFTEKIIDCFITGTVPIYYGCPSIGNFFNTKGMIIVNSADDIVNSTPLLNEEKYNSMLPYIRENYEIAQNYLIAEDYIYENIFTENRTT